MFNDYRAWNKREERYIYHVQQCVRPPDNPFQCLNCFYDYLTNSDFIVEQSIGLTDLNGHDIYENDIVKGIALGTFKFTGKIVRNKNCFIVKLSNGQMLTQLETYQLKIIGNTHEGIKIKHKFKKKKEAI